MNWLLISLIVLIVAGVVWLIYKQQKKKRQEKDKSKVASPKYKVVLRERLSKGAIRTITDIEAERWIDKEDRVVYLRNVKAEFFEIMPSDENNLVRLSDEELDKKIEEINRLIKSPKERIKKKINIRNLEVDLMKWSAQKRSHQYSANSSYISLASDGMPEIYYLRDGSTFFPFKWDPDTSTVYTASDNKKKKATISLKNKEDKYRTKKFIETSTLILLLLVTVVAFIEVWGAYKMFNSYDDSEIAAAKRACLVNTIEASQAIENSAKNVQTITDKIAAKITQPDVVIAGIQPR